MASKHPSAGRPGAVPEAPDPQHRWDRPSEGNVSLDVMPGETLLITGSNGSGKSTPLKAIYGLLPPWNADAEITRASSKYDVGQCLSEKQSCRDNRIVRRIYSQSTNLLCN